MSSPPPGKRAKGGMIRIPSYIAAALGPAPTASPEDLVDEATGAEITLTEAVDAFTQAVFGEDS